MSLSASSIKEGDGFLDLLRTGEFRIVSSESGSLSSLTASDLEVLVGEWNGEEGGEFAGEVAVEVVCEMVVIALCGGVIWSVLEDF